MAGPASQVRLYRFAPFELDPRAGELRKHGIRIKLREQPVRILLMLLDHPGEVVLREEIRLKLWPNNTIVEFDHGINAAIQKLRDALGESADKPRYVETVARRGYRFLGEVERIGEPAPEPPREPLPDSEPAPAPRGSVVSHYRLLDKLGEGGMGVVYRAEDLKLGRHVAVKFLPMVDGELPESVLRRFEREARAASALNHPNICTIHGLEDFDGRPAIVMELVEGETLAARLARGRLPVEEAVGIAIQIADALAEAHRRGVVHRDLKPANIMLTGPKSRPGVKVLDFGLAKMERPVTSTPDAETVTERGAIVGTLHYMSPEQVEGKDADARSDIFSFGLVLYEMATGQRAFEGESRASVIAAILEKEPPPCEPEWLNRVMRACIAKDSKERFQTARDVRRALEWGGSVTTSADSSRWPPRAWIAWAVAVMAVALGIGFGLRSLPRTTPVSRFAFTIKPPADAPMPSMWDQVLSPEISPDGSTVLYFTYHGLYVRRLDSLQPQLIRGSQQVTGPPFWSADSRSVFFPSLDTVIRVRIPDGAPESVAQLDGPTRGGSSSDTGMLLISQGPHLFMVSAGGGKLAPLDRTGLKRGSCRWPEFLPGSNDFLFLLTPPGEEGGEVYLATLRDGKVFNPVMLMGNKTAVRWTPSNGGRILFVRGDDLYSQKLNQKDRKLEGEAELIQSGVASVPGVAVSRAAFSISRSGVLAWRPGRAALNQVTIFDRKGTKIGIAGPPSSIFSIALAPDEKHVLARGDSSWVFEPGQPGRVSLGAGAFWDLWAPDGSHLIGTKAGGIPVERTVDGAGEPGEIGPSIGVLQDISPDGRYILAANSNIRPVGRGSGLFAIPLEGPVPARSPQLVSRGTSVGPRERALGAGFSPDGHWIVWMSSSGIYVQSFPSPGLPRQIAKSPGFPVWRKDGREIVFVGGGGFWSIRVENAGGELRFGAPQQLFSGLRFPNGFNGSSRPLAVSRDGSRIYFVQAVEQPADSNLINILSGWWHN